MITSCLCPQCGRSFQIPEVHAGKKCRCQTCGSVFLTPKAAAAAGPGASKGTATRRGQDFPPWTFNVKAVADPDLVLKGPYRAEVSAAGLTLTRKSAGVLKVPVGTPALSLGGGRFSVDVGGREVTLAVSQFTLYANRLAADLVRFLGGEVGGLALADYKMPWFVTLAAFLPVGIGVVGMAGGAIGGAIGGALACGLIGANLVIARKEKWPLAARVGACLAVDGLSYLVLVAAAVAVVASAPGRGQAGGPAVVAAPAPGPVLAGWGTVEDPGGDCRVTADAGAVTIEVPGTVHNLALDSAGTSANAPRVMTPVDGDFVAEVKVLGDDLPADPPAATSQVAFHGAGLLLWGDAGNFVRLERAAFERGGLHSSVLFEHHKRGAPVPSGNFPHPGGPAVYLRLERRGQLVSGFSSPDGTRWQPLMSAQFEPEHARVGVAAVNTASAPFVVRFEGFKVGKP